ncbi:hypothetical protein E3N88_45377 [Mikania micrantha]|uniref:BED-type domain-containing protein n=1 Tax=Mikania micrantha TaxID=192012 RepID=A0A5N6L9H2_9ASTR|nr:hypothetical protein E3N88_45377 [Mikania micrantha]
MQGSTSNPRQEGASIDEENTQNPCDEDEVVLKRKRQKSSTVWEDFIELTLPDGKEKVECIHCKKQLARNPTGTTSTYKRHLANCMQRKQFLRTQQLLNFQPVDVDMGNIKQPSLIGLNAKYDLNKMREAMANWIMAIEQPFNTVEDDMFVYMMKTANPMFERLQKHVLSFVHVPSPRTGLDIADAIYKCLKD